MIFIGKHNEKDPQTMNMNTFTRYPQLLTILLPFALLTACGGGGSTNSTPTNPTDNTAPSWKQGTFEASDNFAAQCENPRIGNSPITGIAYPDKDGSELIEKHWQRAFTHETYLWYKEVIDKDPKNYSLSDYFDQLKTTAVTDSGKDKDYYHFIRPTSEVEELTQLGVSYGYGILFDKQQSSIPRQWVVQNITPNTQAFNTNVSRGSKLLAVDGIDFINNDNEDDIDTINNAIYSNIEGEAHTFKFIDNEDNTYEVELQTAAITGVPLQIAKTIETPQGKTGYILLNSFYNSIVEKDLFENLSTFTEQNISELVVDLRYNGGGYLALSSQLAYMIAGSNATTGKTYETTVYNDKIANKSMPFYNKTLDLRRLIGGESIVQAGQALPTLNLNRVYVLTTGSSCSASESFINALIGIDIEVIQIGETTCGKPYGFDSEDNCGSTYYTIQFKGENNAGFGDYTDGLMPVELPAAGKLAQVQGCPIIEDYQHDLGDEQELLLASALYYQANNDCPDVVEQPAKKMKSMRSHTLLSEQEIILHGKTPLQDAIIRDAYINQYRHINSGSNNNE
tara:strand:- start:526 stop:2226 length:1701 start_codon:yes stop_codon:yes gene_type:complete